MNKIQKEILRLSRGLTPITEEDVDCGILYDLEMNIADYYSYNGSYFCGSERCCSYREPQDEWEIVKFYSAYNGYRVDRYVEVRCHKRSINAFPIFKVREVAQEWHIGKESIVLKRIAEPHSNIHYTFWDWRTGLAMRDDNTLPNHRHVCIMEDVFMELIKADFSLKAIFDACKDANMIKRILKNNSINKEFAEYLAKTKQKRMLAYYIKSDSNAVNEFAHSIKVAYRHGYKVRSIKGWFSYLHKLARLNLDTHNPFYICPTSLKVADKIAKSRIKRLEEKIRKQNAIEEANKLMKANEKYIETMKAYLGITFASTDGTINFKVLQNVKEFISEGQLMHNCIGHYYSVFTSLCLVALDSKTGEHLANVEISLKDFSIVQCYAPCNTISKHDAKLRETLNLNMDLIKQAA